MPESEEPADDCCSKVVFRKTMEIISGVMRQVKRDRADGRLSSGSIHRHSAPHPHFSLRGRAVALPHLLGVVGEDFRGL
jgi:hypothetical protein